MANRIGNFNPNQGNPIQFDVRNPWDMISKGLRGVNRFYNERTSAILGRNPGHRPSVARQDLFRNLAGLVQNGHQIESNLVNVQRANTNAVGNLNRQGLHLPAEIARA